MIWPDGGHAALSSDIGWELIKINRLSNKVYDTRSCSSSGKEIKNDVRRGDKTFPVTNYRAGEVLRLLLNHLPPTMKLALFHCPLPLLLPGRRRGESIWALVGVAEVSLFL